MDAILHKQIRNSRWTRDPVIGSNGAAVSIFPTDRDIEIFELLARYRYLSSDFIHAFVGGNAKALSHRLNLLSRKPNLYLTRPGQQRQSADANYRPLIYELDERGAHVLCERGFTVATRSYARNFRHELMVSQIAASLELGTREKPYIRLITWPEILRSAHTPKATRESPAAAAIPVSFSFKGNIHNTQIIADGRPFGLERVIDGRRSFLFFPGIEADCGTEPIHPANIERSSIAKKFSAYTAVVEQGLYRSHFGFPNFFVPVITTGITRMRAMMQLLDQLTGRRGSKIFLFKSFPSFTSTEKSPAPNGHMLTAPWQRVGFPPFSLDR